MPSAVQEEGKRAGDNRQNINKALDKEWEKKSLKEIAEAPVSALQGLAAWCAFVLVKILLPVLKSVSRTSALNSRMQSQRFSVPAQPRPLRGRFASRLLCGAPVMGTRRARCAGRTRT